MVIRSILNRAEDAARDHRVRDPEEVEVHCLDCNAKLFNSSIYDHPGGAIRCPDRERCKEEEDAERRRRFG